MKPRPILYALLALVLAALAGFALFGCGGSSGTTQDAAPLSYTGITTQAALSIANAPAITRGAFASGFTSFTLRYSYSNGQPPVPKSALLTLSRLAVESTVKPVSRLSTYSDAKPGQCGGWMKYTLISYDDGTKAGDYTYINFCLDDVVVNGSMSYYEGIATAFSPIIKMDFASVRLQSGFDDLSVDGTIEIIQTGNITDLTLDALIKDNFEDSTYRAKDFALEITPADSVCTFISVTGTFYHPDHGYVGITTPVDLYLCDDYAWPASGRFKTTGAGGTSAELTFDTGDYTVKADADADGTYEWSSAKTSP